ncbi:cell division protein FtsA [Spiroplasma chrysopicola]|uniref:Cell division protein FtsA n=1 Tax=Spiroplasma chrysopicola DF-1 TaxID=1276227 RepID=R4UBG0_9MOLU|nr:cell division protein FtsA [Spiroplasma chrysopicola]AGM25229.1 cell division protein FtsA [Spiroplasma chrysopicola DF-1]
MDYKLKEVYAVLEIKEYSFSFMVGIYSNSNIKVLYKKHLEYRFCENGKIMDEKNMAKELSIVIKDANRQLGLDLQRVAVSIPSHNLKIKTSTKMLNLTTNRLITKNDIDALIGLAKEVPLLDDETTFFIRPYRYILNEQKAVMAPPIDFPAHKVSIKAIVYVTKKQIIQGIFNVLKYAKVEVMGILPESFSLAWNIASPLDLQNGITIVDWDYDSIKAHIFVRETLCEQIIIPGGIKKIIMRLRQVMNCDYKQASKYLYKIINLNNKSKDNLVIYSKYLPEQQTQLNFTHHDLTIIVNRVLEEEIEHLNQKLATTLKKYDYPLVVVGDILKISGFKEQLLVMNKNYNLSVYLPETIGAREAWCTGLLGNIYYQHLANKVSGTSLQAVDQRFVTYLAPTAKQPEVGQNATANQGTYLRPLPVNQFGEQGQYQQNLYQNLK